MGWCGAFGARAVRCKVACRLRRYRCIAGNGGDDGTRTPVLAVVWGWWLSVAPRSLARYAGLQCGGWHASWAWWEWGAVFRHHRPSGVPAWRIGAACLMEVGAEFGALGFGASAVRHLAAYSSFWPSSVLRAFSCLPGLGASGLVCLIPSGVLRWISLGRFWASWAVYVALGWVLAVFGAWRGYFGPFGCGDLAEWDCSGLALTVWFRGLRHPRFRGLRSLSSCFGLGARLRVLAFGILPVGLMGAGLRLAVRQTLALSVLGSCAAVGAIGAVLGSCRWVVGAFGYWG